MSHDILIVGGGIGGAVLANLLSRGGKQVLVLEKNPAPTVSSRPEILWAHTVEFLRTLIPPADESRWVLPLGGIRFGLGHRPPRHFHTSGIRDPRARPFSTAGQETRRLLLEHADCEIQRGVEVRGLLKEEGRVVGVNAVSLADGSEREWRANWTVGDDGPGSLVRREMGILLTPRGIDVDMLSFGLDWPEEFPYPTAHVWINPRGSATGVLVCGAIPQPGRRAAAVVAIRPRAFANEAPLQLALAEFAGQDPRLAQVLGGRVYPQDLPRIQLKWGNAPAYFRPGAALVGDAAHPVTPAGGQGANLAVADARLLAETLLRPGDPQLSAWEHHRRRAANRSLWLSRGAAFAASLPEALFEPLVPLLYRLAPHFPNFSTSLLRVPATAFW